MKILLLFVTVLAIACFSSCTRDPVDQRVTDTRLSSSIEGNVVAGGGILWNLHEIRIRCGNQETALDSLGNFFFNNVELNTKLDAVTIVRNGKTIMVRSFRPNEGHNYIRIELWPDFFSGSVISTGSDYNAEFGNELHVQIPAGSFAGSTYTLKHDDFGAVDDNSSALIYGRIPGNLIEEDVQGNLNGLQVVTKFFYFTAVNSNDIPLDLINGKKITMTKSYNFETFDPPYYLYFLDRQKGTWKRVSEATHNSTTKNFTAISDVANGFFVIAHPFEVVKFTGKLVAPNGNPVYSMVRINKIGEKNYSCVTYANNKGEITGYLPKNVNTEFSLIQSNWAGDYAYTYRELIFNKSLGSFGNDVDLESITCSNMGDTVNRAILTYKGRVVDCNNNPVAGAVIAPVNIERYPASITNASGEFAVNFARGAPSFGADKFVVYNPSNNQRSQVLYPMRLYKDATKTSYDLGTLKICNSNTDEFMTFTVDGQAIDYRPPVTPLKYYNPSIGIVDPSATTNEYVKSVNGNLFDIGFYGNFGVGPKQLSSFSVSFANIVQWLNTPIYFTITENRNTGSFYVAGSFQNLQVKYADGNTHRIDCSFRVRN